MEPFVMNNRSMYVLGLGAKELTAALKAAELGAGRTIMCWSDTDRGMLFHWHYLDRAIPSRHLASRSAHALGREVQDWIDHLWPITAVKLAGRAPHDSRQSSPKGFRLEANHHLRQDGIVALVAPHWAES